jgi:dTDP-glucose pyrophosphorylase
MISDFFILPNSSISEALAQLDKVKGLGLVVVDEEKKLLGSLTDGDMRRAMIAGKGLNDSIQEIYHRNPTVGTKSTSQDELRTITADKRIKIVPIVDNGKVVDIFSVDDEVAKNVSVVIMAGGLGSRLGEFTKDCPKPMLDVGGKPVLERIIRNFTKVGFKNFYISVNYKAEMIEDYFKDGQEFGCRISYLKEKMRLGTAGSLTLLPSEVKGPVIVTNGDLLTLVDYRRLLTFHQQHKSPMTLCTREFEFQVPYGVVNIENGQVKSIDEKPKHSFNVSAGVYVINSDLLKLIPRETYFDMPTFLDVLLKNNIKTDCFPMIEQWIDIGRVSDLDLARSLYGSSK